MQFNTQILNISIFIEFLMVILINVITILMITEEMAPLDLQVMTT